MSHSASGPAKIDLVLPYYNEENFIEATLRSLIAQRRQEFSLVLVDNASTDGTTEIAKRVLSDYPGISTTWLTEERPGQLYALQTGIGATTAELIGTVDADTYYPPSYVGRAIDLAREEERAAAVLAVNLGSRTNRRMPPDRWLQIRFFPDKCHAGGAGHIYRRSAYERSGGFDETIWRFVLFDHEIVNRIGRFGKLVYDRDHVIFASDRRDGPDKRSWTPFERLLYKILPENLMDWFFYTFLARRLAARSQDNSVLRARTWS